MYHYMKKIATLEATGFLPISLYHSDNPWFKISIITSALAAAKNKNKKQKQNKTKNPKTLCDLLFNTIEISATYNMMHCHHRQLGRDELNKSSDIR